MGVQRTIIRPHPRDNQLSPIPIDFDPETLGWILDEGGRGNLMLQNELFNTMEARMGSLLRHLRICYVRKSLNPSSRIPSTQQPPAVLTG